MAEENKWSDSRFIPKVEPLGLTDGRGGDRTEEETRGAVVGLFRLSKAGIH